MASAGLSPRHGQPPNRQPHREASSKQVSEASTEAHCWRLPRCASAPRGRANLARGAARGHGRERRAEATGAGCSCWLSARGEAAAGGPDTAPRGSSACPPARVSTAVGRRVQPSSPAARAAAGGLSQHLPAVSHTPLRDTGGLCPHARAPTAARSLRSRRGRKKKSKFKNQKMRGGESEAGGGAPTPESPSRRGSTAAGERGQVRQSVRRSPVRAGSAGRTCIRRTRRPCGLGHDSAAGPSSHVGSPGPGGAGEGALRGCRR